MGPRDFDRATKDLIAATVLAAVIGGLNLFMGALNGCGGPPREVRHALAASAIAVDATDRAVADRYSEAHRCALAASATLIDYTQRMSTWNDVESALRVAHSSIQAADLALKSWDSGGNERWLSLVMCAGASLARVARALEVVGVEAPPEIASALRLLGQFGELLCVRRQAEVSP